MGDLIGLYEEIADFVEQVESLANDVPDFEDKEYVENDLNDAKDTLNQWLENNKEWYDKQMRKEEFMRNAEFERSRL